MKFVYTLIYLVSLYGFSQTPAEQFHNKSQEHNKLVKASGSKSTNQKSYKILALGDSYTIGESVCNTCRFPEQLKDSLNTMYKPQNSIKLKVIATTGWTTTNLINGISEQNLDNNFDLVTLLIGVNNQYQNLNFSIYEKEFPELVKTAIKHGKGNKANLIVISIPDYAYTPFGKGNKAISEAIDKYNAFAEQYCILNNITFINITDITRKGLNNTELVASDKLHPSTKAYTQFVKRLLPWAKKKLEN